MKMQNSPILNWAMYLHLVGVHCVNTIFNGITFTVDMIDDNPDKIRLFALRSFGESLYHSITDASLEFGYKAI